MFDLPSMLGEYLLPLVIVLPLAVVVLLIAARASKEDARPPAPPPWTPPVRPPVVAAPKAPAADIQLDDAVPRAAPPRDFQPTSPFLDPLEQTLPDTRAFTPQAFAPTEPAPLDSVPIAAPSPRPSPIAYAPTEPAPLDDAPAPPPAAPWPAVAPGTPLLVVDDSAVVRAKLSKLLSAAGYAVTLARHGQEALEQIQQHWFAVMITDLEMPEMDGFELIAHVSNDLRTENLPIIAITGHEALQAKVQDAKGLFGIFKKPWNDRELLARVAVLTQLRPRS